MDGSTRRTAFKYGTKSKDIRKRIFTTKIRPNDTVRDINPTWVNYNDTGRVITVRGNLVAWRSFKTNKIYRDTTRELQKI